MKMAKFEQYLCDKKWNQQQEGKNFFALVWKTWERESDEKEREKEKKGKQRKNEKKNFPIDKTLRAKKNDNNSHHNL